MNTVKKLLLNLGLTAALAGCIDVPAPDPPANPPTGSGNNNGNPVANNPPTTPSATTTTPETLFLSSQCLSLDVRKATTREFTVNKTTTFLFRYSSQFKSAAAILSPAEATKFANMQAYQAYILFDEKIGTQSVTLAPGTYYVGVRNHASVRQQVSYELDYATNLPASDRCQFVDYYLTGSKYVDARGGLLWHEFEVQNGFRYFLDGVNTGDLETWIIPASQLSNFTSRQQFQAYHTETTCNAPGMYEVKVPPGKYYFATHNRGTQACGLVYVLERWRRN